MEDPNQSKPNQGSRLVVSPCKCFLNSTSILYKQAAEKRLPPRVGRAPGRLGRGHGGDISGRAGALRGGGPRGHPQGHSQESLHARHDGHGAQEQGKCTVWGGSLFRRFCNMFSESFSGRWAVLQLPCCPRKQGKLSENILQNLRNKLPPQTVVTQFS